jgi:threonine aldolase
MGQRLGAGIAGVKGAALTHPVQANMVFADWETGGHARAMAAGAMYYQLRPAQGRETARLVASWNTTEAEVDAFIAALRG